MSADRDQRIAGNARIGDENARIGDENARIETSIPWIDTKNSWIEHIKRLRAKGMMTAITSSAIISVLEDLRENQVIGTGYINLRGASLNMNNQNGQTNILIEKIRNGNNKAWEELISQYKGYIHSRAWEKIKGLNVSNPQVMEEELFAAGWIGFVSALRNHDTSKGSFTTYATCYIDGEMSKQLDFEFNSMGLTERPQKTDDSHESKIERVYAPTGNNDNAAQMAVFEAMLSRAFAKNSESGISIPAPEDLGDYTSERRALQVLDVLKLMTDEDHSLTCDQLRELLSLYRKAKYANDTSIESYNTFNKSMAEILLEVDPGSYTDNNDSEYRVKYEGYEEDHLINKVKMKKDNANKVELAPVINGLRYVHDFDNETLDKLINKGALFRITKDDICMEGNESIQFLLQTTKY